MFVWVKIPSLENTYDLAMKDCLEKGLFVLPGEAFNYDSTKPSQYIRLCYSYSTPDEVEKVRFFSHFIVFSNEKTKRLIFVFHFRASKYWLPR